MGKLKYNIKYFGSDISNSEILKKINIIKNDIDSFLFYLIIAGTNTVFPRLKSSIPQPPHKISGFVDLRL